MKTRSSALVLGVLLSSISFCASADMPGKHPFYLHALSDLRTARWMLEHRPGDAAVSGQPAQNHQDELRLQVRLRNLGKLYERVSALEKRDS